ncbi:MAG: hypothetical protein EWV45_18500 [Microcystis flos-aquae Mf_QC_C_20070823_S10D]|uniref:Uncharacterized protein n=1 Tax=Microcystis flos-aquae Mf_QC_C_20070823_S10D TaxID=2486236 RepID=A0A552KJE1_9CHRO|nr:MAG: hypothetical protein EWV65_19260 [Microcystis flos-aquae Ma_QC_C_20070823_S18D]TRV08096.1 MAG: hypothetical protein EWV45_18500 [Microcystis flos-aquae Mf_QC_C_20070823_S10D]TRV22356.1 MAG: hypothetical protein EWV72_15325 [Microcystis flos-aquae Mf_QC_C_20070823_S10]TRV29214.1 MAG: hypothetical protein EWV70_22145 [Microcystis flos-aquae Mf_QC_C_20070823_S20]TRV32256.1 MAG: hypothetical protein EWV71_18635 [Microcystis flos-aquae Mf_QC_C_20070823_S20D]TRV34630.1 MAG: hypothetical prot
MGDRRLFYLFSPHPTPHTPHPTPHTLHPTPHTPHPTPYTPHPTPSFKSELLSILELCDRSRLLAILYL